MAVSLKAEHPLYILEQIKNAPENATHYEIWDNEDGLSEGDSERFEVWFYQFSIADYCYYHMSKDGVVDPNGIADVGGGEDLSRIDSDFVEGRKLVSDLLLRVINELGFEYNEAIKYMIIIQEGGSDELTSAIRAAPKVKA